MTRELKIFVQNDGYSYPGHFICEESAELNGNILKAGIDAVKTSQYRAVQQLTRQLDDLKFEREKEVESLARQLEDCKNDHKRQIDSLTLHFKENEHRLQGSAQQELKNREDLFKAQLDSMQADLRRLTKELEDSKQEQLTKYQAGVEQGAQQSVSECQKLRVILDSLTGQLTSAKQDRQALEAQMREAASNYHTCVDQAYEKGYTLALSETAKQYEARCAELQAKCIDLDIIQKDLHKQLQIESEKAVEQWKSGVEYGKKLQSELNVGRRGEEWVRNEIVKAFPDGELIETRSLPNQGDFHFVLNGVRLLLEVKNTKDTDSRWVQKFKRDLQTCSLHEEPVQGGLYINLQDTRQDLMWRMDKLGDLPYGLLDNTSVHCKLLEVAIRTLVYSVLQNREHNAKLNEDTRKMEALQNELRSLVEGSLQKAVKDLVSSANCTLLRARDCEAIFVQQILNIIDRKPVEHQIPAKRVNQHPARKRVKTVTKVVKTTTIDAGSIETYFRKV